MIYAWRRQQDTIGKAEETLRNMINDEEVKIENADYNALLHAYARRGDAKSILSTVQQRYDNRESDIRPNGKSYSTVVASALIE